jgi:hypothetical protein
VFAKLRTRGAGTLPTVRHFLRGGNTVRSDTDADSAGPKLRAELIKYMSKVTPLSEPAYAPPILDAKAVIAP